MLIICITTSCSAQQKQNPDACMISKNVERYGQLIESKNLMVVLTKRSDNCNLLFVNSLYATFLRKLNRFGFEFLANVANQSDGYVSDYIVEKMGRFILLSLNLFLIFYTRIIQIKEKINLLFWVERWSSIAATSDNDAIAIGKIRKKTKVSLESNKTIWRTE